MRTNERPKEESTLTAREQKQETLFRQTDKIQIQKKEN